MEKQQPESEDGIEGLRTTVRYPAAAEWKKKWWGLLASAEKTRAGAVGDGQSESGRGGRPRGDAESWLESRPSAATWQSCQLGISRGTRGVSLRVAWPMVIW